MTSTSRDVIFDFTVDPAGGSGFVDRINLAAIDAKAGTTGGQSFSFIGASAFSAEGQVRAFQFGNDTMVQINTTGTNGVDASILLAKMNVASLGQVDFVL